MTVTDCVPDTERLVQVLKCLLWLITKVVDIAEVGERHGFAAPVTRFAHQTQRFAVFLDRFASRLACPFGLELCCGGVGTLGGHACAVGVGRSSQFLEAYLVSS